jgi:ABC-type polar amino acid transport system ATPase subunit
VSFDLRKGETLGIVCESGYGRSTTSLLITALMQPTAGEVAFDEHAVGPVRLTMKDYCRQVQMVFQDSYSSLNPRQSADELIAFNSRVHGLDKRNSLASTHELLATVGLDPAQFGRHGLSGGQRQQINIARALALRPRLIILGEPVSAVDKSVQAQVLNLLVDLKAQYGLSDLFSLGLHSARHSGGGDDRHERSGAQLCRGRAGRGQQLHHRPRARAALRAQLDFRVRDHLLPHQHLLQQGQRRVARGHGCAGLAWPATCPS